MVFINSGITAIMFFSKLNECRGNNGSLTVTDSFHVGFGVTVPKPTN